MNFKTNKKLKYLAVTLTVILVIIILLIFKTHLGAMLAHKDKGILKILHFNPRRIKRYILSYGKLSAVAFVVIYALKPILIVVPASLFSIMAGSIFGPWKAFMLSMISCFLSGSFAFFLAQKLGKPFVDKILKGKIMKLDDGIEKHGFIIMLLMRLSFVFPYDPLSYAAGLTKMKYRDFILGTVIGVAPEMLAYSFMGRNLERSFSIKSLLPILLIIIIASIAALTYKKYKTKND